MSKNCVDCLLWKEGLCNKKRIVTKRTDSCKDWVSRSNVKEKEKIQLADSYVPNIWDKWKKEALRRENERQKNWEIS